MKIKLICLLLCTVLGAVFLFGCKSSNSTADNTEPASFAAATEAMTEPAPPSTPDESGAIISAIEGYNANSAVQSSTVGLSGITLPYEIPDTSLKITAMGGYSGEYVEDSSDENVEGVFAIIVQNTSQEPLKMAKIVMTDQEGNEYSFKLSTLPGLTSAIVMEEAKASYSPDIKIEALEASESYLSELSLNEDKISLSFDGENLKITNITDSDFTAVYVRYKNFTYGNVYLGGITYSATFDNVLAGQEYTYNTQHLSFDRSQLLMIEVIE